MNNVIKIILGILVVLLLLSIGGMVLKLFFSLAWLLMRLIAGALVVLFVIWLINQLTHGSKSP
jgi:hypothetical protein